MAVVTTSRSRLLPALYPLLALVVGALLLPSALRPPPEQTSDSAALNPNAPPDEQQDQIVLSQRQAQGGAGSAVDETATTLPPPQENASGTCFAGRQTESVYSAPCAPAFKGNNGGATAPNVFPNEIRLGFWHTVGAPAEGRLDEASQPNDSAATRTFRVLARYFNKRFERYGRKVVFYGMTGNADPAVDQAAAQKAWRQDRIFAAGHLNLPFCEAFQRQGGVAMCNPQTERVYDRSQPGMLSFMLDRTKATGFGAEFVCKRLLGKNAIYSGNEKNTPRKISIVTETTTESARVPISDYEDALKKDCGGVYGGRHYEMAGSDAAAATTMAIQMKAAGTTTVMLEIGVINTLLLMTAAESVGWQPEWVQVNAFALDFNGNAALLPPTQASHLFGLTAWEIPRRPEETECYAAYKEIDPDNEADSSACVLQWHTLNLMLDGIQQAGPKLTRESYQQGLYRMGNRYPAEPWAIGGGYSQGDYSYMDDVNEIWFSRSAISPLNDQPGAYVYSFGGKRFKRGELPKDDSQLFKHGVVTPGGPDQTR